MKLHTTTCRQRLTARDGSLRRLSIACGPMSNSNITQFRNSVNSSRMRVYVISNRDKTGISTKRASPAILANDMEVRSFASGFTSAYHQASMLMLFRRLWMAALAVLFVCSLPLYAGDSPEIMPLSQIHPGMKGVAYTIFEGDQIEKMDLVVLGTLRNALGPKQDVILVKLVGEKVERTGVVAGNERKPCLLRRKAGRSALAEARHLYEGSDRRRDSDRKYAGRGKSCGHARKPDAWRDARKSRLDRRHPHSAARKLCSSDRRWGRSISRAD